MEEIGCTIRTTKNHARIVATHVFVGTGCELTNEEAISMNNASAAGNGDMDGGERLDVFLECISVRSSFE